MKKGNEERNMEKVQVSVFVVLAVLAGAIALIEILAILVNAQEMQTDSSIIKNGKVCSGERCYFLNQGVNANFEIKGERKITEDIAVSNSKVEIVGKKFIVYVHENGVIKINRKEFNVRYDFENKKEAKFVFNDEYELIDGTDFVVSKSSIFELKGNEIELKEGSNVKFENSKVLILLPDGGKISDFKIIDQGKAKDSEFEFTAKKNEKIKLPDSLGEFKDKDFSGILKYKNGNYYFSDNAKVNGFYVSNEQKKEVFLFGDGKVHPEIKGGYISFKKNEMIIGQNEKNKGIRVSFDTGNDFFKGISEKNFVAVVPGKDKDDIGEAGNGLIKITKDSGDRIIKIEAKGDYKIYNGEKVYKTGISDGKQSIYVSDIKENSGKIGYSLEIIPLNENDDYLFKDKNGKGFKLALKEANDREMSWVNSDYKIEKPETNLENEKKTEPRIEMFSGSAPPASQPPVITPVDNKPETGRKNPGEKTKIRELEDKQQYKNALDDVRHYGKQLGVDTKYYEAGMDKTGGVHETTHAINNALREKARGNGKVNAFYLLDGKYVVLSEPEGVTMNDVGKYVPEILKKSSSYSLYMKEQKNFWNKQPLYVLDEFTAYTNGGIYAIEKGARSSLNIPEFMSYSLALGQAIEAKNPAYWNSANGQQFRDFLAVSLYRGMDVSINQVIRNYPQDRKMEMRGKAIQNFVRMTDPKARDFAIRTFGNEWTKINLGF